MNLNIKQLKVDMGGGPGSRGGHVIGKTSSGKPIYANAYHREHGGFNKTEHLQARDAHLKQAAHHESIGMKHAGADTGAGDRSANQASSKVNFHHQQAAHHAQYASGEKKHPHVFGAGFQMSSAQET